MNLQVRFHHGTLASVAFVTSWGLYVLCILFAVSVLVSCV